MRFETSFVLPRLELNNNLFNFNLTSLPLAQQMWLSNINFPLIPQLSFSLPQWNFWNNNGNSSSYIFPTSTNTEPPVDTFVLSTPAAPNAPTRASIPTTPATSITPSTAVITENTAETKPATNIAGCKKADGSFDAKKLYEFMNLESQGLSFEVFGLAIEGYNKLPDKGNGCLGIFDTTQESNKDRYYLLDLNTGSLIGRSVLKTGSGDMSNVSGANKPNSHATLSGFMKVGEEYYSSGKNRQSMRLNGLEKNINDNARTKAVVVHHVKPGQDKTWGCLGYSPVLNKDGQIDYNATYTKMRKLFPENTIIFTQPCRNSVDQYRSLSKLYS